MNSGKDDWVARGKGKGGKGEQHRSISKGVAISSSCCKNGLAAKTNFFALKHCQTSLVELAVVAMQDCKAAVDCIGMLMMDKTSR